MAVHPCEIVNQLVQNSTSKIKLLKQICKLHLKEKPMIPTIGPMCHAFGMNQAIWSAIWRVALKVWRHMLRRIRNSWRRLIRMEIEKTKRDMRVGFRFQES